MNTKEISTPVAIVIAVVVLAIVLIGGYTYMNHQSTYGVKMNADTAKLPPGYGSK